MKSLVLLLLCALAPAPPSSQVPTRARERRRNVDRLWQSRVIPAPTYTLPLAGDCTGGAVTGMSFTRATAATCTKSTGVLVKLTSGQPAVNLDRGLLIEQAGVNFALRSEALDNAAWTSTGSVVTADFLAAPDGTTTADRVVVASPANVTVSQAISGMTSSALHAASAYAHESTVGAGGTFTVGITNAAGTHASCTCYREDGGACTATNSGTTCAASMTMTGTWVRLVSLSTASAAVTATTLFVSGALPGVSAAADYTAWGMQLEQEQTVDFATTYIPTTTTSATRNNAVASIANPLGTVSNQGCASVDIWMEGAPISGANRVITFTSGRGPLIASLSTSVSFFDGTNNFNQNDIPSSLRNSQHIFAGWRGSDTSARLGGGVLSCNTTCVGSGPGVYTGSLFAGATCNLGNNSGAANFLNGYLKNAKFYALKDSCQ